MPSSACRVARTCDLADMENEAVRSVKVSENCHIVSHCGWGCVLGPDVVVKKNGLCCCSGRGPMTENGGARCVGATCGPPDCKSRHAPRARERGIDVETIGGPPDSANLGAPRVEESGSPPHVR